MNPDSAVRPWLLAVGKQFGIRLAYNYRYPDNTTRPQEPYFTYRVLRGTPQQDNIHRANERDEYTAVWKAWQNHHTIVRIKLYREVNGVEILTQCSIAAMMSESIKQHFRKSGCAFMKIYEDIEDETPEDIDVTDGDFRDQIKQRMDVTFNDNIMAELREENGIVETLSIDLGLC